MTEAAPWPSEIKVSGQGSVLEISFDNGDAFKLTAEFLRVESPSAEVKGHGKGQEITVPGKRAVKIVAVERVGNYAVRIRFDDRHDTGLYSWTYLRKLGSQHNEMWGAYLEKLEAEGKTRD
jgi:DUF971 family protein